MMQFIVFLAFVLFVLPLAVSLLEVRRVTFVDRHGALRSRLLFSRRNTGPLFPLANYAPPGVHENSVTRFSDVNVPVRNLLFKRGSTDSRMTICGPSDYPLGFCPDETTGQSFLSGASTYNNYPLTLLLLGSSARESRVGIATGAVVAGTPAYTAASGHVQAEPSAAGTYYHIGTFLVSGADGDEVEIDTCTPRKVVIS